MDKKAFKLLWVLLFCFFAVSLTNCTSSDEDTTALEAELENLDGDEDTLEEDDIEEVADEDLVDEVDDDDLDDMDDSNDEEIAEFDEEELDDGEDDLDEEMEEVALNDDDGELDEDDDFDDEDFGDDDDAEFAEFDEFEEEDKASGEQGGKSIAQDEASLQEELNQQPQDFIAQNGQPMFPEEVVGQGAPPAAVGTVPPAPLPSDGAITSETAEIVAVGSADPQLPQDDLGEADPIVPIDDEDEMNAPSWVPVVKVKTDPFFRNQKLLNAVYIARPGDDFRGISEKLYGDDRVADLKNANGHLLKGIDPGDKVYYNSPNRPDDRSQLKVYYDDIGLAPQYYKTKSGDNMRRLGSKLLGFSEGWKEVWAINQNVDSKTILPGGMELRYWTGNENSMSMAKASVEEFTADPEPIEPEQPEMPAYGQVQEVAEPELPPEPPLPEAQLAGPDPMEPQEIPDIEAFPEPGIVDTPRPAPAVATVNQDQTLLSVGAIALLLIAGLALVAIQIKKRGQVPAGINPQSLEYTQV